MKYTPTTIKALFLSAVATTAFVQAGFLNFANDLNKASVPSLLVLAVAEALSDDNAAKEIIKEAALVACAHNAAYRLLTDKEHIKTPLTLGKTVIFTGAYTGANEGLKRFFNSDMGKKLPGFVTHKHTRRVLASGAAFGSLICFNKLEKSSRVTSTT